MGRAAACRPHPPRPPRRGGDARRPRGGGARARRVSPRPPQAGPRQRPGQARPRPSPRHRQRRARRALARDLGHARLAGGGARLRGHRRGGGRPPRPPRRLRGRTGRRARDASDGRRALVSPARARPGTGRRARGGAHGRGHRPRRGLHAHLRPPHARPGADHHRARVRGSGPRSGGAGLAHRLASRPAECHRPHRDPGLAQRGLRHPRRGFAVLPGARHPAPRRLLGQHDQCRPRLSPAGALDRLRPGGGSRW